MNESIKVNIDDSDVKNALNNLIKRVSDLSPVMRHASVRMLQDVEETFKTEGKNLGQKWEPLKPSTVKIRTKNRYTPIKILSMRGDLGASLTSRSDAVGASVSTNSKYGAYHNFGFSGRVSVKSHSRRSKSGKTYSVRAFSRQMDVKARKFMALSDGGKRAIINIFEDEIFKIL